VVPLGVGAVEDRARLDEERPDDDVGRHLVAPQVDLVAGRRAVGEEPFVDRLDQAPRQLGRGLGWDEAECGDDLQLERRVGECPVVQLVDDGVGFPEPQRGTDNDAPPHQFDDAVDGGLDVVVVFH
jgi:hypothetical protein